MNEKKILCKLIRTQIVVSTDECVRVDVLLSDLCGRLFIRNSFDVCACACLCVCVCMFEVVTLVQVDS